MTNTTTTINIHDFIVVGETSTTITVTKRDFARGLRRRVVTVQRDPFWDAYEECHNGIPMDVAFKVFCPEVMVLF